MKPSNPEEFLVLVVDDIGTNCQVIGNILKEAGYATTFATNGQHALDCLKTVNPDLILLDLVMPEMDGLQVCEKLKAVPDHSQIPVIFLTASNQKDHLLQAFERGAVDYVTKPFDTPELLARVGTHLELKSTRDQLNKVIEEMGVLAITDPLTGVLNRRHLLEIAEKELARTHRYSRQFSVLMLDIDHFKQINDTCGHAVGDEAIKTIAKAAVFSLREGDSFGRFGGEEFVALLPETNVDQAFEVAEQIRNTVAKVSIPARGRIARLTVSIGIASHNPEDRSIDALLKRADDALYEAKRQGRNRVIVNQTKAHKSLVKERVSTSAETF
ncbi:MAG: diguanylate cyclase [Cyanothece sp. SIO1E1]|nr:diguanylate cyclase [Cyanothece sp. SIO1E1]